MSVILVKDFSNEPSPLNAFTAAHPEHLSFTLGMIRTKLKRPNESAFVIRVQTEFMWKHVEPFTAKPGVTVIEVNHEQTQS